MKILLFFCIGLLLCSCSQPLPPYNTGIVLPAGTSIKEEKEKAEKFAFQLKEAHKKDSKEYLQSKSLYNDAKASFSGWLEELRTGLKNNKLSSEDYNTTLKLAVEKNGKFTEFAQKTLALKKKEQGNLEERLKNAGEELLDYYIKSPDKRKPKVIELIERYNWEPF